MAGGELAQETPAGRVGDFSGSSIPFDADVLLAEADREDGAGDATAGLRGTANAAAQAGGNAEGNVRLYAPTFGEHGEDGLGAGVPLAEAVESEIC